MGWYHDSWLHRKKITVDHTKVAANVTDFPKLVKLASDADLAAEALANGYDLLITSADGTTKLSHERVFWDESTGQLILWFKAPSLSSTVDTDFYLYYGNSSLASDSADPTGVWKSEYKGVWHLNEASGTRYDSTGNNNDLSDVNTVLSDTGKIGMAANLVYANSEYLQADDSASLSITSDLSWSSWIKFTSTIASTSHIMNKAAPSSNFSYLYQIAPNGYFQSFYYHNGSTSSTDRSTDFTIVEEGDVDVWRHFAYKVDVSEKEAYLRINNSNQALTLYNTNSTSIYDGEAPFRIGSYNAVGFINAAFEEFRLYSGQLSDDWIATEYANQNSPSTFYTLGSEENSSPSVSPSASTSPSSSQSPSLSPSSSQSPSISPSSSQSPSVSPSASTSPSSSQSPSISPSSSESPSVSPSASVSPSSSISPSVPDITEGSTTWGHETGVTETNTRTFTDNWTGTGTITGSGDSEIVELNAGEYMESEIVSTGASATVTLLQNTYNTGDDVTIKYRHGDSEANCEAAEYQVYSTPFSSAGYVQIRLESTL